MKLLLLHVLLVLTITVYSKTSRNRVQIQDGTLVTDKGTLLRGAYISTDVTEIIPSEDELSGIKSLGLNCIHLYAECPQYQIHGERVILVDSIINMAEKDSLYVILTIGGCYENGQFDSAFVHDFWDFYAPRYADKTHVIFEIVNEPFSWAAPYDSITLEMEKWAYNIIRSHAPETHILLMSYANAVNDTSIVSDIRNLGGSIDWSNASIAIHGYGALSQDLISFISTLKDSGLVITFTEPESIKNEYVNLASTRIFEQESVSYAHFVSVQNIMNDPLVFKTKIESSEIRWTPDFGTWPESITEIDYVNPYEPIEAAFYDDGYGFDILFPETVLGFISTNDYTAYYNLDFQDGPEIFEAECSSAGNGGTIELHLDSLDGTLVGSCIVTPTGDWEVFDKYSCTTSQFDGIHKLYLIFKGNNYDLLNLKSFVFKRTTEINNKSLTLSDNQRIQIYPNPAFDKLYIPDVNSLQTQVFIYDLNGKLVIRKLLKENTVDISDLVKGVYLVKLMNNENIRISRLVKE
jgi:hypothetical protein